MKHASVLEKNYHGNYTFFRSTSTPLKFPFTKRFPIVPIMTATPLHGCPESDVIGTGDKGTTNIHAPLYRFNLNNLNISSIHLIIIVSSIVSVYMSVISFFFSSRQRTWGDTSKKRCPPVPLSLVRPLGNIKVIL